MVAFGDLTWPWSDKSRRRDHPLAQGAKASPCFQLPALQGQQDLVFFPKKLS